MGGSATKILVIDLLYLGDLIFATPFFRNLRKNHPQARIDLVANANFVGIIEDNPHLDNIYAYDKEWSIRQSWDFAKEVGKNNYDLGFNIHGNWRTALLLRVINPTYSVGYGGKGRGIFLFKELPRREDGHMVENYLAFLEDLDLEIKDQAGVEIHWDSEAEANMEAWLKEKGLTVQKLVALNTGGSWATKRWTKQKFAELGDRLAEEYSCQVLFLGGPGDVERVEEIVEMMETKPVIAVGETTIKELAALTSKCELVISGDTGPVHVAAGVGTPVVTLFGPSDEQKYRPYSEQSVVVKKELQCRPCGEHECPQDHHRCMRLIEVDEVLAAIEEQRFLGKDLKSLSG
ncbi:lipopolysaccharide heptosyltransferase II [Fuchsiella alkaliacetigena]|uniref:lipopolysaccharide heptosyltransferase II n=1 Tax=Fuchsiella alkaliacetigena TaxID=957042 RepID=UPI00200A4A00|nr:lipopolysaccharide heptosyltransferase II [Fuchsiella alkaliacetigena]MCK8824296.1 lipopolysaccharide heptosyltransferase II [Fuchsiella alkaliacetigena]